MVMGALVTSPEVVDLQFALQGRSVPFDYADPLWDALREVLPWLADEALAGVHPLYGLSPGRGEWYLSRRSQLSLRLPLERIAAAQALTGASLNLADATVEVGKATEKAVPHTPVLYSRFVTFDGDQADLPDEGRFFAACQAGLAELALSPHSVVCGRRQTTRTAQGTLHGFSLMVMGLNEAATQRLLAHGLGVERKRGCGIFMPHKSNPSDGAL